MDTACLLPLPWNPGVAGENRVSCDGGVGNSTRRGGVPRSLRLLCHTLARSMCNAPLVGGRVGDSGDHCHFISRGDHRTALLPRGSGRVPPLLTPIPAWTARSGAAEESAPQHVGRSRGGTRMAGPLRCPPASEGVSVQLVLERAQLCCDAGASGRRLGWTLEPPRGPRRMLGNERSPCTADAVPGRARAAGCGLAR